MNAGRVLSGGYGETPTHPKTRYLSKFYGLFDFFQGLPRNSPTNR